MKEALLHYVWQYRRYSPISLNTQCGQPVQVLKTGHHNTHAGADFQEAHLYIGKTKWVGAVEIHLKSSDWNKHQHQHDPAYNNVILHVVWEDDHPVYTQEGERLLTLELKARTDENLLERYQYLMTNQAWIACEGLIAPMSTALTTSFFDRLLVERLEQKAVEIEEVWNSNRKDWGASFYQFFCKSLGLKINADPMFQLAQLLPYRILAKHRRNHFQLESLLFGVAGFLQDPADDYAQSLALEFRFLQHKYGLLCMNVSQWKFLRLRPASFPTVRLAQLAAFLHQHDYPFSILMEVNTVKDLEQFFCVSTTKYWETHYRFGVVSKRQAKRMGKQLIHAIVINTLAPFYILYAREKADDAYVQRVLSLLMSIPAEKNSVIEKFEALGIRANKAGDSQALLQLKKEYCQHKRCLSCAIGVQCIA